MLGARLLIAACLALLAGTPGAAQSRYDAERTTRVSPAIAAERATAPPPSAPRQFTVGDVSTPELRASFQTYVARTCGLRLFRVSTRYVPSNLERGAMVGPSVPAYGQTVGCGRGVLVQLSEGPSSPPDRQPPRETPPVIVDTYPPPREQPLLVDNFRNLNRIQRFEARVAQKCGAGYSVTRLQRPSSQPPGQYDGQQPDPETVYECGMPVTVWTAAAREVPDLLVGDLSVDGGHALAQQVARKCDQELQVDNQERHDRADPGVFVSQSPPPATVYRCGMGVTIVRSLGPVEDAWRMPRLRSNRDVATLQADARGRCDGRELGFKPLETPSARAAGTVISQAPTPGSRIACTTNVTLTMAIPIETPPPAQADTPPPPDEGIVAPAADVPPTPDQSTHGVEKPKPRVPDVPTLVGHSVDNITTWRRAVAAACDGDLPGVTETPVISSKRAGTVLKQTPSAGQPFACGGTLTVDIAGAAPPPPPPPPPSWWRYIVAALAVAALAGAALWWFLTPRLVFGVPRFGGSTEAEGLAGALPLIALEARAGTAEVSASALPIDKTETDDGR